MRFIRVAQNKKDWLELLLLADESEEMIDRYLDRGEMFLLAAEKGFWAAASSPGRGRIPGS